MEGKAQTLRTRSKAKSGLRFHLVNVAVDGADFPLRNPSKFLRIALRSGLREGRKFTDSDYGNRSEHRIGVLCRIGVLTYEAKFRRRTNGYRFLPTEPRDTAGRISRKFAAGDCRQWWLWSSTVLVLILLTVAVASFAFPAMLSIEQQTYSFYLNQSVRALVGLVLLFAVYLVYQQMMIMKIRNQIADQVHSLTKVENLTNEVYKLAALDQLTGLYNRRSGEQRLAEEISRAVRHQRPLTVLLMDLDGLKQINDRLGHAAGDMVLKGFSERLQRAIRDRTWPCVSEAMSSWSSCRSAARMKSGT